MADIIVFSDSHGNTKNIEKALSLQIKKPDALLFLGDGLSSFSYIDTMGIKTYFVSGNCDVNAFSYGSMGDEFLFELNDKRIFMTHGHKYDVKYSLVRLIYAAREKDADIVLFGHTHIPYEGVITKESYPSLGLTKNIYLLNPGSVKDGHFGVVSVDRCGNVLLSHGRV